MVRFEFLKILKQKMFFLLVFLLLIGNMVSVHIYEKNKAVYYYIYENRELYERFQNGEKDADLEGYYTKNKEQQEAYQDSYKVFLHEMQQRADKMKMLEVYSDKESYVYRNIEKTCKDFSKLSNVEIIMDNNFGVLELAEYEWGLFFVFIFLVLFSYYLFYQERNRGLFLLVKGTKNGHHSFIKAKLVVISVVTGIYVLLQEICTIFLFGYYYGYGDLSRSIQSVSEFRNCPFAYSVGQAIFIMIGTHLLIAEFLAIMVSMISILIQNEITAIFIGSLLFALEYALYVFVEIGSGFNIFKCVNPFYCWNFKQKIGTYLNLNICSYAIGKDSCARVAVCIGILFGVGVGMFAFHRSYQIRSDSKFEKLKIWIRQKTGILWRHTNLLRFEFSKVFVQQKKGVVFVILLLFCISEIKDTQKVQMYSSVGIAQYHSYLKQLSGKITEESVQFVFNEAAYVEELYAQLEELGGNTEGKNYVIAMHLESEIQKKEQGVQMLTEQLKYLQTLDGNLYEKYWVDEIAYGDIWGNVTTSLGVWLLGMLALSIWISGIYPVDEKKKMLPLLRTTKNGIQVLHMRKNICIAAGSIAIFLFVELPSFYSFYQIDHFKVWSQKMCDFSRVFIAKDISLGVFLLLLFLLKFLTFFIAAVVLTFLSQITRNEAITSVMGIGAAIIIFVICYYLHGNIGIWLLRFLS